VSTLAPEQLVFKLTGCQVYADGMRMCGYMNMFKWTGRTCIGTLCPSRQAADVPVHCVQVGWVLTSRLA